MDLFPGRRRSAYFISGRPGSFFRTSASVMKTLSLFERFYVFVNGVFDLTAIVYFVTFAAFFLFLSVQSLEKRRYN